MFSVPGASTHLPDTRGIPLQQVRTHGKLHQSKSKTSNQVSLLAVPTNCKYRYGIPRHPATTAGATCTRANAYGGSVVAPAPACAS